MLKQKAYLFLEDLAQLNDLNLDFVLIILVLLDIFFKLIVLLKPDFNWGNNFALSWVDKVTIGT